MSKTSPGHVDVSGCTIVYSGQQKQLDDHMITRGAREWRCCQLVPGSRTKAWDDAGRQTCSAPAPRTPGPGQCDNII